MCLLCTMFCLHTCLHPEEGIRSHHHVVAGLLYADVEPLSSMLLTPELALQPTVPTLNENKL